MTEYVWLGELPVATIKPDPNNPNATKVYRIEPDHLGTLRRVADSQNNTVWRWSSAPFGDTVPNEDPGGSGQSFTLNQRFAGQYFDRESGMHYNYNRYYDPATGRYDQSDPIGLAGGINTYAYVGNNPLSYTDPLGLDPLSPNDRNRPSDRPNSDRPGENRPPFEPKPPSSNPSDEAKYQQCMSEELLKCPMGVVGSCAPICGVAAPTGLGAIGCAVGCACSIAYSCYELTVMYCKGKTGL